MGEAGLGAFSGAIVGVLEPVAERGEHRQGEPERRDGAAHAQGPTELAERPAGHVLERHVVGLTQLAGVEHPSDVGVIQLGRDLRCPEDARHHVFRAGHGHHGLEDDGLLLPGGSARPRDPHLGHRVAGDAPRQIVARALRVLAGGRPSHAHGVGTTRG